jgi:hypothetical protein
MRLMSGRFRAHIRSNLVAYIALFVALSGSAYAAATIDSGDVVNNSLKSADLKNGVAVKGVDVRDDKLTGLDVDESTIEAVDAATLDGQPRSDYVFRSFITGPTNREQSVVFYSYVMVTPEAGTDYFLGQIKLKTTASANEFQICGASGLSDPIPYVLTIEGNRTEDTVAGDGCETAVNFGDRCDFELAAAGARVFGAPTLGAGTNCHLLALQSS